MATSCPAAVRGYCYLWSPTINNYQYCKTLQKALGRKISIDTSKASTDLHTLLDHLQIQVLASLRSSIRAAPLPLSATTQFSVSSFFPFQFHLLAISPCPPRPDEKNRIDNFWRKKKQIAMQNSMYARLYRNTYTYQGQTSSGCCTFSYTD